MVTANEGKRHQALAESLGVDKYLLKPVPLERLLSAAVEVLGDFEPSDDDEADEEELDQLDGADGDESDED
jgi:DNA-binding response OmpR family regulator